MITYFPWKPQKLSCSVDVFPRWENFPINEPDYKVDGHLVLNWMVDLNATFEFDRIQIDGSMMNGNNSIIMIERPEVQRTDGSERQLGPLAATLVHSFRAPAFKRKRFEKEFGVSICPDTEESEEEMKSGIDGIRFRLRIRCGVVTGHSLHILALGNSNLLEEAQIHVHLLHRN